MKLFEVLDLGSIRSVLAVKQGEANRQKEGNRFASIPFVSIKNYLQPMGIATPDALIQVKDKIDPTGDVIDRIENNGTIVLKTMDSNPTPQQQISQPGASSSVDKMASSAAKKAISSKN